MASLNTLRTKFGVLLSVIIALALLAFVFSLKTEMGFSNNDPKVGVIDGDKINYSEYYEQYEQVKNRSGASESDEQQVEYLANATWQQLFSNHVLVPGFSRMGLTVSESERLAMISGEYPTQAFYGVFGDSRTGDYNVEAVNEFLSQAAANPQAQQAWAALNAQARLERQMGKFLGLVKNGVYTNKLEVEAGVQAANRKYSGRWASKKYTSIPDSLVTVSNSEIKSYYNAHKEAYRQKPSISLSYVVFDVDPTSDDLLAIAKTAEETGAEFAAAEDVKAFVRANRNGQITNNFLAAVQLSADEAEALMADRIYGPVEKNNAWTMSRVVASKMVPDSLGVKQIVLPYSETALADSLMAALKGGADFAQLAADHSYNEATAQNGGEVGVLPFSAFPDEFAEKLADAKKGDVVMVQAGGAIQLLEVYRADKPSKHVQVATITYPLEASAATRRTVHNEAGSFSVAAKGSVEKFNEAAAAKSVMPIVITQGERSIRGLEDSREIVRWAYGAKKGDVSEIFNVGKDYVVAVVTDVDNEEYTPVNKVAAQIKTRLLREKRFDMIAAQLSGATIEEQAASLGSEVETFENVAYGAFRAGNIGFEPRVQGAIAAADKGVVSPLVMGNTGAFVFVVDEVADDDHQTSEAEKVRLQALAENAAQQKALPALQEMADIQDLRGRYF